jgi:hypothetical protein
MGGEGRGRRGEGGERGWERIGQRIAVNGFSSVYAASEKLSNKTCFLNWRQRQRQRQKDRDRDRDTETATETQRQRQRHRDRDTETETEGQRQRQRQRDRDKGRDRDRDSTFDLRSSSIEVFIGLGELGLHPRHLSFVRLCLLVLPLLIMVGLGFGFRC